MKDFFNVDRKILAGYEEVANVIKGKEEEYKALSDDQLKEKTNYFLSELEAGTDIYSMVEDILATVTEAAERTLRMRPFKVQLMGALAIIDGNIAEMKTGEGKSLMSTIAAYYMALNKKGVHIVTVNDYLAMRDAQEMSALFNYLGLTVGYSSNELQSEEKKEAYSKDITYVTNNELGFDYLRDNMAISLERRVLRGLDYVIIDEIDSILIDEARTPLIISGQEKNVREIYPQIDAIVKGFKEDEDYVVNLRDKVAILKDSGIDKIEKTFIRGNLFDVENSHVLHAINNALKANYCMAKEVDYVVKDGLIIIVDQFTGRLMHGRTFNDGLHQALEAKESLKTQKQTKILASITFQNFFRLYNHICGMTGTAKIIEEEFQKTYGMYVIEIPTNRPMIRKDRNDVIFLKQEHKYETLTKIVKERHEVGQPILIGTVAIETSEEIANELRRANINPVVLNAKHNDVEAEIVKNAGQYGAITIATNMAGRGTDIKVEDKVKELPKFYSDLFKEEIDPSGLMVIGTERHESRRIDDQLRGRSGRQGDAGESIFLVSFEDTLLNRFKSDRLEKVLSVTMTGSGPINNKFLTGQIEKIQREVESINYESRKNVVKYDDVLRGQREVIYSQRDYILNTENIYEDIKKIVSEYVTRIVDYHTSSDTLNEINDVVKASISNDKLNITENYYDEIMKVASEELERKLEILGEDNFNHFLKVMSLKVIDEVWVDHIDEMATLRNSIGLRGYGQVDPLHEYQREGRQMFEDMTSEIEEGIVRYVLKGKINSQRENEQIIDNAVHDHSNTVGEKQETVVKKEKIGRNDKCPCGSGKKYKDCCGK